MKKAQVLETKAMIRYHITEAMKLITTLKYTAVNRLAYRRLDTVHESMKDD